jgi:hypothetical protein
MPAQSALPFESSLAINNGSTIGVGALTVIEPKVMDEELNPPEK